jgi:hypothetical protein
MLDGCITWIKYCLIIMKGIIIDESVVKMFGSTWIIYGNVVKKVRD